MFCNNGVLRNFARIHRKTPVPEPLLKKRLWRRCFSVNFAKFLRHLFLQNNSGGCFWIRGMTVTRWVWTNSGNSWNVISGYLYWNKVLIYPVILLFGRFIFLYLFRSSYRRCSVRIRVLRNFGKFTGKHLCQSLFFNKVADIRPETLLKRDSGSQFCKISENAFFIEHL